MSRCRFVQPDVVRLPLVDVHKRAKQDLITTGIPVVVDGKPVLVDGKPKMAPATPEELAAADAAIKQAEDDAEWVDVKAELNAGETRRIFTDLVKDFRAGEQASLDPQQVGKTKILNYLVAWSFKDRQGASVPVSEAALANLDVDTFNEISAAVDWHDASVEEKRAQRKNGLAPAIASAPIL